MWRILRYSTTLSSNNHESLCDRPNRSGFFGVIGAYTVAYFVLCLLPGVPLSIMLSASGVEIDSLSAVDPAKARAYYGLDQSVPQQYLSLVSGAVHGDFGQSIALNRPVAELLAERLRKHWRWLAWPSCCR